MDEFHWERILRSYIILFRSFSPIIIRNTLDSATHVSFGREQINALWNAFRRCNGLADWIWSRILSRQHSGFEHLTFLSPSIDLPSIQKHIGGLNDLQRLFTSAKIFPTRIQTWWTRASGPTDVNGVFRWRRCPGPREVSSSDRATPLVTRCPEQPLPLQGTGLRCFWIVSRFSPQGRV